MNQSYPDRRIPVKPADEKNPGQSAPERLLTEAERAQADLDRYISKATALANDVDLNTGQTDLVAFARFSCRGYGYCRRDKFVANFLSTRKNKRHIAPSTARIYLRHAIKCGFVLGMTDVHGNDILIAHDKAARMAAVYAAKTAEVAEAEASALRVAQVTAERERAEKLDFLALARAAAAPAENIPESDPLNTDKVNLDSPADAAQNFTATAENFVDSAGSFDGDSGKFCSEVGKILLPIQMGIRGGISPGTSMEISINNNSGTDPSVVEESPAFADAEAEDVVVDSAFAISDQEQAADDVLGLSVIDFRSIDCLHLVQGNALEPPVIEAGVQGVTNQGSTLTAPRAAQADHLIPSAAHPAMEAPVGRIKPALVAVTDPRLLDLCREVVLLFGHLRVRMEHVHDLISNKMPDAKTTTQVSLLTATLDVYEIAVKNPTVRIEYPWNFFCGILEKKVFDARAQAAAEPKTYTAPPVKPLAAPEHRAEAERAIAALSPDDKIELLAETLAVTRPSFREKQSVVTVNMTMMMAERLGYPVEPWRASPAEIAADQSDLDARQKPKHSLDFANQQTTQLGQEFDAFVDKATWLEQAKAKLIEDGFAAPKDVMIASVARGLYVAANKTQDQYAINNLPTAG